MQALEADIRTWIEHWNANRRPFTWTKTAEEILDSLAKYRPDFWRGTLEGRWDVGQYGSGSELQPHDASSMPLGTASPGSPIRERRVRRR
jgi:hypothetical protein